MKTDKEPLLSPLLRLFMGAMILANIAGRMQRPLLPLYLQELGANVEQIGLFFTLSSIAPLALQILGGWLSDSLGRLRAIAIGSIAGMINFAVLLMAPSWEWLLIATVGAATSRAFIGPSYQAFIAEQADKDRVGRVYGVSQGLFTTVDVVGPPLGGYLVEIYSFREMFAVAACLYAVAAIIRILMARQARHEKRKQVSFVGLKNSLVEMVMLLAAGGIVTWLFVSDGILDITFSLAEQLAPLYTHNLMGLSMIEIGWLSSIMSITTILLIGPASWLSDKKGERIAISLGGIFVAMGQAAFLISHTFVEFAGAWMLVGAGTALFSPAYNALVSKAVPNRLRGVAFGLFSSSIGLISLPAPYIAAQLWERFSPRAPFVAPIAAVLLILPVVWIKFKLPKEGRPGALTERSPD